MRHELKTWPEPFEAIWRGDKRHEIRSTRDRTFAVGDAIELHEYDPKTETYSGRVVGTVITYMTNGGEWGLPEGMCVLSIAAGARFQ